MTGVAANADSRVQRYLKTYLEPAPVQEPVDANTDPQLSTLITTLLEEIVKSPDGTLFDIGCGKGTLLERLSGSSEFVNSNWIYVAVDFEEMLAEVQAVARKKRLNRRVELLSVDDFYKQWPDLPRPHVYFCRNVLHELTIPQTADLLRRLSDERKDGELVLIQDLMNFQEGERNNVCWSPEELVGCIEQHGLGKPLAVSMRSKSGALWLNCVSRGPNGSRVSPEGSLALVRGARHQQWQLWAELEQKATQQSGIEIEAVRVLDLDVQYAALTRQLRDAGLNLAFDKSTEKKLRNQSLTHAVKEFIVKGQLKKNSIVDEVNFRERGEQLNGIEDFLRGGENLAIVAGGSGIGKTTFVHHLLSRRGYDKSPVLIDGSSLTDVWSFVESVFSQLGLKLNVDVLSSLKNTGWHVLESSWKSFVDTFASRMIVFIDDFHRALDTNGRLADKDLEAAIGMLLRAQPSKLIISQNERQPSSVISTVWGQLNPFTVQLRRFASTQTVINVLDDRVDRKLLGIDTYPERLMAAIDRHPLAARLAADVLRSQGAGVLNEERFLLELEERLFFELWNRLVNAESRGAVEAAKSLRIPIPQKALETLSSRSSVEAGLASSALFGIEDRTWTTLVTTLELFRRRSPAEATPVEEHGKIADIYVALYREDDDPKWIRESYFHRLLSYESLQPSLGSYYFRELIGSAEYCFRIRRHDRALELYNFAATVGVLPEDARMHRASCLVRTKDRPAGDNEYQSLFEEFPRSQGMKKSFISALLWIRAYEEALEKFNSLGIDQNDAHAAGLLGRIHLGLHNYEVAEALLKRVVGSSKLPNIRSYIDLAHALQYQGAVVQERDVLAKALQHYPGNPELIAMDGAALERLRKGDEAVMQLQPLFDLYPEQTNAAMTLVKIYARRSEMVYKARGVFEKARREAKNPEEPIFITMEAEVLKGEGRADAAVKLLREKTALDDQHSLGMYFECAFHAVSGSPRVEAKVEAAKALKVPVPVSLLNNAPLMVNRARLAVIADDHVIFQAIRSQLDKSRTERFVIEGLDRLWMDYKQGRECVR